MDREQKTLYHGSQLSDLKVLMPNPHNLVERKPVVFATPDIRFALAMIYGADNELAVGYTVNAETHEEKMYIEELQLGAFELLAKPGYIYEVSAEGFYADSALTHIELIKDTKAEVLSVRRIENILVELRHYNTISFLYKNKVLDIRY